MQRQQKTKSLIKMGIFLLPEVTSSLELISDGTNCEIDALKYSHCPIRIEVALEFFMSAL